MLLHVCAEIFIMVIKQKMMVMWEMREIIFNLLNVVFLTNSFNIN